MTSGGVAVKGSPGSSSARPSAGGGGDDRAALVRGAARGPPAPGRAAAAAGQRHQPVQPRGRRRHLFLVALLPDGAQARAGAARAAPAAPAAFQRAPGGALPALGQHLLLPLGPLHDLRGHLDLLLAQPVHVLVHGDVRR
eukprot:CAMPEP_0194585376 /NCGR_PEP_ID=MMETSP0292-20121207/17720_1 /TAXON_ID=39354 /ORGANISM="Heterosigma akashiwo, Strain CCMP2393" /LENGTH=139 /DNA_ID=CAMNT_0039440821 /DNA_START=310 /DNA_END=727 /DNA_ORIENTATION=+